MSEVLTKVATALLAVSLPVAAPANPLPALTGQFAACAGRLSATMEHQWLMGEDARKTERDRAAMVSLIDAVARPEDGPALLAARIEAKFAHAALLARATFNDDPVDAAWAQGRAEVAVGTCRALLLG